MIVCNLRGVNVNFFGEVYLLSLSLSGVPFSKKRYGGLAIIEFPLEDVQLPAENRKDTFHDHDYAAVFPATMRKIEPKKDED